MSTELRQVESAECHCPCHNPLTLALHPVRCCETCPWCGRRIVCTTLPQQLARCPTLRRLTRTLPRDRLPFR